MYYTNKGDKTMQVKFLGFTLSVSEGNRKMGDIPSVSFPPVVTCPAGVPCAKSVNGKRPPCYALKAYTQYPNVREAYDNNLKLYNHDRHLWQYMIYQYIRKYSPDAFRFNVSGDAPSPVFFKLVIEIAREFPNTQFLAFTKRYTWASDALQGDNVPGNLHIVLSAWEGMPLDNPLQLPEAHVRLKSGACGAREDAIECPGKCDACIIAGVGCYSMGKGDQVVFNEH
jgi:hypothetical protein